MKTYKIIFFFAFIFTLNAYSQTGPAGVGNSSTNVLWLDASRLGLSNNDPVSSWTDMSGNNNDADQATASNQPTFLTNQINTNLPVIDFDGTDDHLPLTSHITTDGITIFSVFERDATSVGGLCSFQNHAVLSKLTFAYAISESPGANHSITKPTGSYSIFSVRTDNSASGSNINLTNGSFQVNQTRNSLINRTSSVIGARIAGGTPGLYFDGRIAELIVYNSELSAPERDIIIASLSAKYNLTGTYSQIYSYASTHPNNVKGIGQESDGSNLSARGIDSMLMDNPSSMGDGDYLLVGHDNAGYGVSSDVPALTVQERWAQVWRADVTGSPGTVDIEFFLNAGSFASPSNYAVIIESNDGDFSNGDATTHITGRSYNALTNSIKFTGVSLNNGDYFTLAELQADITAISDGAWKNTSTWSCGCIPTEADIVTIGNTFDVTVDSNARVLNLTVESGGSLTFSGSDTLDIEGTLTLDGTFTRGSGVIAATGSSAQTFDNGSGSVIDLNSLFVNNSSGLDITSGEWAIVANLQVSAGNLDVSGATSMTLRSTPTATSQILESVDNGFTGDFIVERYIGARNAGYSNISSPIIGARMSDLDDDLFLSGLTGGEDGNALTAGGDIFYSIYTYNINNDSHDTVQNITDFFTRGKGYEVYLATTFGSYDGDTIDFVGTPTIGIINGRVDQFWNLLGNPYHCYIDWDLVETTGPISSDYYIFDTDNGSYTLFTGAGKANIAPEQGFWVYQSNSGGYIAKFREDDKVGSNSPTFLRKKQSEDFEITIQTKENRFKQTFNLDFDINATSDIDEIDAPFLQSPVKEAPALFSYAMNSDLKLMKNSINPFEENHLVPLSIYTGVEGEYSLVTSNIEGLFDNYSCVYLKDNETDESVDLSIEETYNFNAGVGSNNRFNLILSNSYEECQKLINQDEFATNTDDKKFSLRNSYGLWYVDYTLSEHTEQVTIEVYNMNGQLVTEPYSFSAAYAGSHQIRTLSNFRGIYLIQIKSNGTIINRTIKL